MNRYITITAVLFFLLVSFVVSAQRKATTQPKPKPVIQKPAEIFLPEYVDVHLDKDFYFTGDRLWYSLYVNNMPRSVSSLSGVVYVELRDSRDSILFRQKIKCRDGLAHGDWQIPRKLSTGIYQLSAFTLWMKNTPENMHSTKVIIVSPDVALPKASAPQQPEEKIELTNSSFNILKLSTNRVNPRPGDKLSVNIDLVDSLGYLLNGNVSISVRMKGSFAHPRTEFTVEEEFLRAPEFSKELFISPAAKGSLPQSTYLENVVPYPLSIDDQQLKDLVALGTLKKILRGYNADPFYERDVHYNIPANNSYIPANYSPLPTLREFFKELIPTVKLRKTSSGRKMFVRTQGTSAGVYFFKEPALVLVDGRVVDDIDGVLEIPASEVDVIDVTWDTNDINRLGLFAMSDNGVVSIVTNTHSKFREGYREVFKDFYNPLIFSVKPQQVQKEDKLPNFNDPAYWNPNVSIQGKGKVDFEIGDAPGKYIIEVVGITTDGVHVYATTTITVAQND